MPGNPRTSAVSCDVEIAASPIHQLNISELRITEAQGTSQDGLHFRSVDPCVPPVDVGTSALPFKEATRRLQSQYSRPLRECRFLTLCGNSTIRLFFNVLYRILSRPNKRVKRLSTFSGLPRERAAAP